MVRLALLAHHRSFFAFQYYPILQEAWNYYPVSFEEISTSVSAFLKEEKQGKQKSMIDGNFCFKSLTV